MTKDRQKLGILIVLLGVLGTTVVLGYRSNDAPVAAGAQTPAVKPSSNSPGASDARILLELVEKGSGKGDIGNKNLFQYRQVPVPPIPGPQRGRGQGPSISEGSALPPQTPVVTQIPRQPTQPVLPPIPLKYQGYAATGGSSRGFIAFLSDDTRHYNVTAGEVLMGRYRISSITDKSVEVEDLENNRRQTLPLLN